MDSSVVITLSSDASNEVIRIRPKLTSGFTFSHTKDAITWITEKEYYGAMCYLTDLFTLVRKSELQFHYLTFEIPGFPVVRVYVDGITKKIINMILTRISDYMSNHWSVFKN
jgi:hypothetical protein